MNSDGGPSRGHARMALLLQFSSSRGKEAGTRQRWLWQAAHGTPLSGARPPVLRAPRAGWLSSHLPRRDRPSSVSADHVHTVCSIRAVVT